MKQIGVYQIRNLVNGKFYIGSSIRSLKGRLSIHKYQLKKGQHPNRYLQNAWLKWGNMNFSFEIVEIVDNSDRVLEREQFHIDRVQASNSDFGYNISPNATSNAGFKHTPEAITRIIKGRRENPPVLTEEGRKRISEANFGNQHGLGYKHTKEAKSAISSNNIGKHSNDELCRKGKHNWVEENIYTEADGSKECRACRTERSTKWLNSGNREQWNENRRKRRGSKTGKYATHCKWGHLLDGDNLYIRQKTGQRVCRTCTNEKSKKYKANLKNLEMPDNLI